MSKPNTSQRTLRIWQLCVNCEYLEQGVPECEHIRAVEWHCEKYKCTEEGLQLEIESTVSEDTVQIDHVLDELQRPESELLHGRTREQLVEMVMKVIQFAG